MTLLKRLILSEGRCTEAYVKIADRDMDEAFRLRDAGLIEWAPFGSQRAAVTDKGRKVRTKGEVCHRQLMVN